ncbi:MAG TPA: ribosome biogenesis GTP-binding protein YihA/YsxC [Candidatus Sulfotelmatobacter sp.]|nr:ribosome biogenesis GTP-binding protein YihA/YsxC [Candidatus Sulfotelmatobacter sp.]
MNVSSAIFDRSAPDLDSCPDETLPEFAFIGRSNVGKSSLLNLLAGKERLARVSPTPGFTKLINFFTINKTWRLVDLPGYGYAEGSRKHVSQFNRAAANYIRHRPNLCCTFLLVDSSLEPQPPDLEIVQWLAGHALQFVIVFTKTDRGTPEKTAANIAAFKERIAGWFAQLPETFQCSAEAGHGRAELLGVIAEIVKAGPAPETPASAAAPLPPEIEPPFRMEVRAGKGREKTAFDKKKLKGARPW